MTKSIADYHSWWDIGSAIRDSEKEQRAQVHTHRLYVELLFKDGGMQNVFVGSVSGGTNLLELNPWRETEHLPAAWWTIMVGVIASEKLVLDLPSLVWATGRGLLRELVHDCL